MVNSMNEDQNEAANACDLFTIGHSNHPIARFVELLQNSGITDVIDVRTVPSSGRYPWFKKEALAQRLPRHNIAYRTQGHALGGRPRDAKLFCDGIADYEAMAKTPEFRGGLDRVIDEAKGKRICLMCSEREPLDCHRCLLIGRALAERGLRLGHILADGGIEPHRVTEERLLELASEPDLFSTDMSAWLAAAYRRRARAFAFRAVPAPVKVKVKR
jgi:uncharacterized protein (DUF488 family)